MNQNFHSYKGDVFAQAGLGQELIKYWNEIQSRFNSKGFTFIEYSQDFNKEYIWKCLFESNKPVSEKLNSNTLSYDGNALNAKLGLQFSDRESYSNFYWEKFMIDCKWQGYFVPVDDFKYFTTSQLIKELTHGFLLKNHFKAKTYFTTVKKDSIDTRYKNDPIAIYGLWQYFIFYADFLASCCLNDQVIDYPIIKWHSRNISIKKFYSYLPSRQMAFLLIMTIEANYDKPSIKNKIDKLLKYAHPKVVAFFENFHAEITTGLMEENKDFLTDVMKESFVDICRYDKKIITTLEILNDPNNKAYEQFLPDRFKEKALVESSQNIFVKIKNAISEISILDILWFEPGNFPVRPQRYIPTLNQIRYPSKIKWHQINDETVSNIDHTIINISKELLTSLNNEVSLKWSSHLINVANNLTLPLFMWKLIDGQTIPSWNLFDNITAEKHYKTYYKKQESLAAQRRRYNLAVSKIERMKSIEEIDTFAKEVSPFFDRGIKNQWQLKITQHKNSIQGTHNYRARRMVELGIIEEQESIDYRTNIWLDEMLQIEEEIKKYVPFVKKAFTAALPIRKTIEFNSERHVQSGIEFDPNTLNDQNKWLRGEVMKTFKSTTKLGDIEQINAFCLDYSGSMKHTRMRNLFKVLYLLVLGLEDRKSYDAFHFFSSGFIEGIDFTGDFTRRKLLFKILSKISDIKLGKVQYGGYMGTNIGKGVLECHNRIHAFKDKIVSRKPNSKFVCSMFVITDGEPSVGIIDLEDLNSFIQEKREDGDIAIKGIYIKSKKDENNFMQTIFGEDNYVETDEFGEAVNKFVTIITNTYKAQRKSQKWKNRLKSVKGTD